MARPHKQTVAYFPHDTDACEGKTLTIIQSKYGNDGYAFWFKLLQLLGKASGHYYDFNNPADWEFLLAKTHQDNTERAKDILETLVVLGAIDAELYSHGVIWCQKFVDRVADAYNRTVDGVPQRPGFLVNVENKEVSVTNSKQSVNSNPKKATEIPQTKLKETKLNNIRGKKTLSSQDKKAKEVWEECLEILKEKVSRANFDTWLKDTVGLLYKETVFIIGVPSEDVARHLMEYMRSGLENVLGQVTGKRLGLGYRIIKKERPDG